MFDYDEAFSRNLGWLTPQEQQRLRGARVAVAGMGGVGGVHVQGLARLGVGALNLTDFDSFELANFNRQAGAAFLAHPVMVGQYGARGKDIIKRRFF